MSKVRLSEIAMVTAGNVAPKAKDFTPDGVPFVRAGSLSGLLETGDFSQLESIDSAAASRLRLKLFPAGTVVFAKSGMSCLKGYVYTLPRECYVVSHLACITPKEDYSQYLKHYFRYWKPNRLIENPSFPSIKLSKISDIELDLPDSDRVQEIVDSLEAVLGAIETEQLQINKLDELVKSRFVEMFGDPGINERGLPTDKLVNLGTLERGKSKHRPRNAPELRGGPNGPYPLVQTGDVTNAGLYLTEYTDTYTELGLRQSRMWDKGTLCITIAANIAQTSILAFDACFPDSVVGFIPGDRVTNVFLHYWFGFFQGILEAQAPQAAQKNINLKILSGLDVIVPPMAEQEEFVSFVRQVDKLKFETQQAIDKLQMLYDSLAQEYFGS